MEVSNVKYDEVLKLIGDNYSKYININESANVNAPFIKESILKLSDSDIKDVNFGQETSGGTFNINKSSFTDLVREAIYCKIGNIDVDVDSGIDNTRNTKGYLKFVKSSQAASRTPNTIEITSNANIIKNIICSMNLVNIFIDILEAYDNFLNDESNVEYIKDPINRIIIVNKYAKKNSDTSNLNNLGYWMDSDISGGAYKPSVSALYLSIKSYSGTADTNNLLQEYIVNYDIVSEPQQITSNAYDPSANPKLNVNNECGASGLFDASNRIINASGTTNIIAGILLEINANTPVIRKKTRSSGENNNVDLSDINNTNIEQAYLNDALYERDKRLFRDFLNLIMKLDLANRQTQIKGLLIYFKVIKEYFHMSLTTGNLLFNSYFKKGNISAATVVAGDLTAFGSSSTTGYAIKYLNNDTITLNSNKIYKDNVRLSAGSIIDMPASSANSGGDIYLDSAFGLAKTENDDVYMKNIIENISELQSQGANDASISAQNYAYISEEGFVANVKNKNTITIKSRKELLTGAQDLQSSTTVFNRFMHITGPDASQSSISNDNTFKLSTLTGSASKLPEKVKNYLRNYDANELSKEYIIRINNMSYSIKEFRNAGGGYIEIDIKARLIYSENSSDDLNDIPVLRLPHDKYTLFKENYEYIGSGNSHGTSKPVRYFRSLEDAKNKYVLFHNTGVSPGNFGVDNKVKLSIKKPLDYKSGYLENINNIKIMNNSINKSESKIKNSETLYKLNKSKNDILYYQLMSYIIILAGIIVALILTYTMNMPKPIIKLVASICFGIVVLQIITYYILNVLYVESFTVGNIEKFSNLANTYTRPSVVTTDKTHNEFDKETGAYINGKIDYVNNQLILLNNKIIQALELSSVGVSQGSSTEAYTKLLNITEFERESRNNISNILKIESEGTEVHIDLLKYKTAVHAVNIKTVLMLSLMIVGLFTVNIYTDNKYMENIVFIGIFALIVILSYYFIYSNSVVRTRSNNFYWGKEHVNNYNNS